MQDDERGEFPMCSKRRKEVRSATRHARAGSGLKAPGPQGQRASGDACEV